jgi:hypothetical protein
MHSEAGVDVEARRARAGWGVVIAYSLLAAATQMLWLTYAAITTDAAHRYGVSVGAIGWLAEIFPLLYVVLAIPAGALLDRPRSSAVGTSGCCLRARRLSRSSASGRSSPRSASATAWAARRPFGYETRALAGPCAGCAASQWMTSAAFWWGGKTG